MQHAVQQGARGLPLAGALHVWTATRNDRSQQCVWHMPDSGEPCRRSALEKELQREGLPEEQKRQVISELEKRESDYTRLQRQRMTANDFEPLNIIGRGAFGEVCTQCAARTDPFPAWTAAPAGRLWLAFLDAMAWQLTACMHGPACTCPEGAGRATTASHLHCLGATIARRACPNDRGSVAVLGSVGFAVPD